MYMNYYPKELIIDIEVLLISKSMSYLYFNTALNC